MVLMLVFLDFGADSVGMFPTISVTLNLDGATMEEQIRHILKAIGEDPDREGLVKTPHRVSQALSYLTRGYAMDPEKVINDALFTEEYEEMIVQKDIDFFSLCEHHMLPFF